ncbi:MAG: tetratricopeptide repeat protein [Endomicrobia bacterium]|nr:tetratricopeptide repeat protein [Endomicrobiia bacterium]MCL2507180.1 tetratricopeptide repeat protein [Endomicrobiia bacterium]
MYGQNNSSKMQKFADYIINQIQNNRTRFFTIIGFTFGFLLLGIFIYSKTLNFSVDASDKLSEAYMYFSYGDIQRGTQLLEDTITHFSGTSAAYQARLVKADLLTEQQNFAEALKLLLEVSERAKPETLRPLALSRIIYLYDKQGDYLNAIKYSLEFINRYKTNFMIRNVFLNLAQYYVLTGSLEDAARVYTEILVNFPATDEAAIAERALNNINIKK